jgi:hypothetical protein
MQVEASDVKQKLKSIWNASSMHGLCSLQVMEHNAFTFKVLNFTLST